MLREGLVGRPSNWSPTHIIACGHSYPSDIVDNDEFFARCRFTITDDRESLARETKMRRRYWCAPGESTWTMARDAVRAALLASELNADEIDVVIVSSCSTIPGVHVPAPENPVVADLSNLILAELGRDGALGFDIKATYCAGFVRALQLMDALLQNPNYKAGLVVASDVGGRFATAQSNRSAFCFIVGDSAGAVVVRRGAPGRTTGIVDYAGAMYPSEVDLTAFGADGVSLVVRGRRASEGMMRHLIDVSRQILERNRLTPADVDWLLPAQTHAGAIEGLCDALAWPREKLLWFGGETGYSASASIPTCLGARVQDGTIRPGDLILSVAVGAGLNSAAVLYRYDDRASTVPAAPPLTGSARWP